MTQRQAIEKALEAHGVRDVRNKATPLNRVIREGTGRKRERFISVANSIGIKPARRIWDDMRAMA